MPYFEGTIEDFYKFLGPRTSNLVTKIARPRRKEQKSCKQLKEDGAKCGKHTKLDAAHLKGRTRKEIITEILKETAEYNPQTKTYKINIDDFEEKFEEKHKDFFTVIEFMCRKHHKAYDKVNTITDNEDDYVEVEIYEPELVNTEIDFESSTLHVKSAIINQVDYLNKENCSAARISHDNWNFNMDKQKLKADFYLLCFNQFESNLAIIKIKANSLEADLLIKKSDPKKISINIPFSESVFVEKTTRYEFEYIESFNLI